MQETFYKALRSINNFDGRCKMHVWLCQIAKNTYFSYYEKQKRNVTNTLEEAFSDPIELKLINQESLITVLN